MISTGFGSSSSTGSGSSSSSQSNYTVPTLLAQSNQNYNCVIPTGSRFSSENYVTLSNQIVPQHHRLPIERKAEA